MKEGDKPQAAGVVYRKRGPKPKPWRRKQNGLLYTTINGRQVLYEEYLKAGDQIVPEKVRKLRDHGLVGVGWVYFIEAAEVGRIKVGYADDPPVRAGTMLSGCPVDLEIVGVLRGTKDVERLIQRGFADLRWKREWFRADHRIRNFAAEFVSPVAAVVQIVSLEMRVEEAHAYLSAITETITQWFAINP